MGNSLRYRFPNFPISQKISAQMGQHDLDNWEMAGGTDFPISQFPKRPQPRWASTIWEIGKWLEVQISQFPNFPKDLSPSGSARFGKWGNWEMAGGTDFPISQKNPAHLAQHDLGNWEIGKSVEVCTSQFPNFPNNPSPDGPALFGKLGNREMAGGTDFPISEFPKRSQPFWLSTIWEIGKLGNL